VSLGEDFAGMVGFTGRMKRVKRNEHCGYEDNDWLFKMVKELQKRLTSIQITCIAQKKEIDKQKMMIES
jgi:hypothetical protein